MEFVAELAEIGSANGGLPLRPVTVLVVGACVRIEYEARTEVLPSLNGSQANRSEAESSCSMLIGSLAATRVPVVGSKFVKWPLPQME